MATGLRRGHLVADRDLLRRLPRMGLAAIAMALTLWFAQAPLFHFGRWFGLISLVTLGVAVCGVAAMLLDGLLLRPPAPPAKGSEDLLP